MYVFEVGKQEEEEEEEDERNEKAFALQSKHKYKTYKKSTRAETQCCCDKILLCDDDRQTQLIILHSQHNALEAGEGVGLLLFAHL